MTLPSTQKIEKKHARSNTRIVPVIPRALARKSVDHTQQAVKLEPVVAKADVVHEQTADIQVDGSRDASSSITKSDLPESSMNGQSSNDAPGQAIDAESQVASSNAHPVIATGRDAVTLPSPEHGVSAESSTNASHSDVPKAVVDKDVSDLDSTSVPVSETDKRQNLVQLPPEFFPASRQVDGNGGDLNEAFPGRSFVFGGKIDSSAPSPAPPASAGSWNSSSEQRPESVTSPALNLSNAFDKSLTPASELSIPPPTSTQTPQIDSRSKPIAPFYPAPAPANGLSYPYHRHWQSRTLQSPRSDSIGSNPESSFGQSQFHPQLFNSIPPASHPNNFYAGNAAIPRAYTYQPNAPTFHPQRGSGHFEARFNPVSDLDFHNAQSLRMHADDLFASEDFSDCLIRVASTASPGNVDINAHAFILSRSPRLGALLRSGTALEATEINGRRCPVIQISRESSFKDSDAFTAALRYLYGGSLLRRESLSSLLYSPKQALAKALSYAAAGSYLEVVEIATTGLSLAAELLLPENLDIALEFALKSSSTSATATTNGHGSHQSLPLYSSYALEFLQTTVRFLVWPLTTSFDFDRTAPQLDSVKRLPEAILDTISNTTFPKNHTSLRQKSISNQKLHGIQLGEFKSHLSASRMLSSTLLSVPFYVLRSIFTDRTFIDRTTPHVRAGLIKAVIAEREQRRIGVRDAWEKMDDATKKMALQDEGLGDASTTLETMEYVEIVEDGHGEGEVPLSRRRERDVPKG